MGTRALPFNLNLFRMPVTLDPDDIKFYVGNGPHSRTLNNY